MPLGRAVARDLWGLLADLSEDDPAAALGTRLRRGPPGRVVRFSRGVAQAAQGLLSRCGASGSDADLLLALAVVVQGEAAYQAVLADPPRLWEAEPDGVGEALTALPVEAYEALTGLTLVWHDEHGLVDDPYLGGQAWIVFAGHSTGPKGGLPRGYVPWLQALLHAVAQDAGLTAWWHRVRSSTDDGIELSVEAGRHLGSTPGTARIRQHPTWLEVEVHSRGRRGAPSALGLALDDLATGLLQVAQRRGGQADVEDGLRRVGRAALTSLLAAAVTRRG